MYEEVFGSIIIALFQARLIHVCTGLTHVTGKPEIPKNPKSNASREAAITMIIIEGVQLCVWANFIAHPPIEAARDPFIICLQANQSVAS